jgi:hypothetical protein
MNRYTDYLWPSNKPLFNRLGLQIIEQKYEITFPEAFVSFFSKNFGKIPLKKSICTGIGTDTAGFFLHIQNLPPTDENIVFDIRYRMAKIGEHLSEKLVPFMITKNMNFVCFCFENDANDPDVVLVITDLLDMGYDRATRYVAENFEFFLEYLEK